MPRPTFAKIGALQVRLGQIRSHQIRQREVCAAQIRSHSGTFLTPRVPFAAVEQRHMFAVGHAQDSLATSSHLSRLTRHRNDSMRLSQETGKALNLS
jgi:hypothetical protein